MNKTFFISDCHFNHDRDFIYKTRGFNSIKEADANLIKNWNSVVAENDDVYILGDFALGTDYEYIGEIINSLNGNLHLIIGNHDSVAKVIFYQSFPKFKEIVSAKYIKYKKRRFFLSHYPTMTSNFNDTPKRALINLHGHTHSFEKFQYNWYMYNVAAEAQNSCPISFDEIIADINEKNESINNNFVEDAERSLF